MYLAMIIVPAVLGNSTCLCVYSKVMLYYSTGGLSHHHNEGVETGNEEMCSCRSANMRIYA